jgi:hypothetical protein
MYSVGCRFFILISGSVSFHVNSTDEVEAMVLKQKQEEVLAKEQGRPVNKEVYGIQVGVGSKLECQFMCLVLSCLGTLLNIQ